MSVTIKDIARIAGVSTTTVSRALNNKFEGMSEETKIKIQKTIEELNYKPSVIARSLVTNKTKTLGLLLPNIANPFFSNLARGVEDEAMQNGYSVFLCNSDDNRKKQNMYLDVLIEKRVDGIISAMYNDEQEEYFNGIKEKNIPVIVLDRYFEDSEVCEVATDNYSGTYNATKFLIENGHRKIACIRGNLNMPFCRERFDGYKDALKDFNIDINEKLIREGDYTIEGGEKVSMDILQNTDATSILCFNDLMAYGVYKSCKRLSKTIPEDISVIGFDDIELSTIVEPKLTTIKQPVYELGLNGARMLINLIEGRVIENKKIKLENTLIKRESVFNKLKNHL